MSLKNIQTIKYQEPSLMTRLLEMNISCSLDMIRTI